MTGKVYLSNAFSFNMVEGMDKAFDMEVTQLTIGDVSEALEAESNLVVSMSNQATCDLFNALTGNKIQAHKENMQFEDGDKLIVMQYNGPRLDPGLTALPEGGKVKFFCVDFYDAVTN